MSNDKVRVLIVDDSAFIRHLLKEILNSDPMIEVIDTASDALIARQKIKNLNPDVLTLDIEMPNMNGLDFLERLMSLRPMPVVMISSLTEHGAQETIRALELGAVDYVAKPNRNLEEAMISISQEICEKVKTAAAARVRARTQQQSSSLSSNVIQPTSRIITSNRFILIGSSTGGVEALTEVICKLPDTCPPILVTQHMPEKFTASFAARLDKSSQLTVHEASDGQIIQPNNVYLAPGGYHLGVRKSGGSYVTTINDGSLVSGHKPSVDFLFNSAANVLPAKQIIAVIMTGMGRDGAEGLKKLSDLGAITLGQNEASCVVYGMPRAAKELGGVQKEIHLNEISTTLVQLCS